jgi:predicted small integral membrane protein
MGEIMNLRLLKTTFVSIIALLCLAYATQNVVNLDAAYASFAYVMSNVDHVAYAKSFMPAIGNPVLIWIALILVVAGEFLAGIFAAIGAWLMFSARNASADEFQQAKKYALVGCAMGVVVWLGFFGTIGAAFFQMWQTAAGAASMNGAFQYSMSCAVVFIIVSMRDE